MLSVHVPRGTTLERINIVSGGEIPDGAVWLDLVGPTYREDKLVERTLGIAVPTREEMQEIEVTSRLYVENGARYMTATLMCHSDTRGAADHGGDVHPVRPSPDHGALRGAASRSPSSAPSSPASARRPSPAKPC